MRSPDIEAGDFDLGKKLLSRAGELRCRVVSGSMEPLLRVGQNISVEGIEDPRALKRFDVIVCQLGKVLTCHFVWRHNRVLAEGSLTTRSLKEPCHDDVPVPYGSVLGRVLGARIPPATRFKIIALNMLRGSA